MREIILVFRSRSQATWFYEETLTYSLASKIINTPKEAMAGCGLAVKMLYRDLNKAKLILNRGDYSSFVGIFGYTQNGILKKLT